MKYLVIGLGNIGDEYTNTRHNIGFKVLDALAEASNAVFKSDRLADMAEVKLRGRTFVLIKPTTYMNLSGKAVNYWMQKEKIPLENIFVVVDDLAIPFGSIRIRKKGSDGGHNGLKDINKVVGGGNYTRLRFGIGSDYPKGLQINYVLGEWSGEEKEQLKGLIEHCVKAITDVPFIGIDRVMNFYNK